MTPFDLLSAPLRACFALWALLLCLTELMAGVLAAVRRRWAFAALALLLFVPCYGLWQVLFDLSLVGGTQALAAISLYLTGSPWLLWLAAFALMTAGVGLLLGKELRDERTCLTPGTVKLFLDKLPCGVCCWRENGRVLFSNDCMNRLCLALTGEPLRNGEHLRRAAAQGLLTLESRVWRFSCRSLQVDGERLQELIASDVTAEYAKTKALERDKAELSQLNRQLREHCRSLDETVRRQEILQAKVNIHEEMNRLMLATAAASGEEPAAQDRIFSLWAQNALLLCKEADDTADVGAADSLDRLAAALKIRLRWQEPLPAALTDRQRALFFSAAQEAIVNAVKHADARTLDVSFARTDTNLCCRFTNDGRLPQGPVTFTGGLADLTLLAEHQGTALSVTTEGRFTLELRFPK